MTLSNQQSNDIISNNKLSTEMETRRKQVDEYCKMEEKQANLCVLLATKVYRRLQEDNRTLKLCENEDIVKVFNGIIQLENLAVAVHNNISQLLKERLLIWYEKSYFGDILLRYVHYYKAYKAILQEYPQTRMTLNDLLIKKPKFSQHLQKLLKDEAQCLGNIDRLDIHLDQIVNLPRRYAQLLQNYIKHTNINSEEYKNISKVLEVFQEIFNSTDNRIDREVNFMECIRLQEQLEPHINLINENSNLQRQIIKQGQLKKISKKSGEYLQRYLILFDDLFLICQIDRLRRKYLLKYKIDDINTITIIENSDSSNLLVFRLISPHQNDEFISEDTKEKELWMKSFKKLNKIKFEDNYKIDNKIQIGIEPPVWHRDNTTNNCTDCRVVFSTLRRRHHCRTCGKIFCGTCSNYYTLVKFDNYRNKQRVCKTCFNYLNSKEFELKSNTTIITNGQSKINEKRKSDYSSSFDEESASFDLKDKCELESDSEIEEAEPESNDDEEFFDTMEEQVQVKSVEIESPVKVTKSLNVTISRTSLKKEKIEIYADFIFICKRNSLLSDDQANDNSLASFKPLIEKQYIRLYDDGTLQIFSQKTDQQPINVINLNLFYLIDNHIDSNMIELKKKQSTQINEKSMQSNSSSSSISRINMNNRSYSSGINLKSRLSLFEYDNYEFNFSCLDKKKKLMALINQHVAK